MKCKLCGGSDATKETYDARRQELVVEHGDGTECKRQPVDQSGRPS